MIMCEPQEMLWKWGYIIKYIIDVEVGGNGPNSSCEVDLWGEVEREKFCSKCTNLFITTFVLGESWSKGVLQHWKGRTRGDYLWRDAEYGACVDVVMRGKPISRWPCHLGLIEGIVAIPGATVHVRVCFMVDITLAGEQKAAGWRRVGSLVNLVIFVGAITISPATREILLSVRISKGLGGHTHRCGGHQVGRRWDSAGAWTADGE